MSFINNINLSITGNFAQTNNRLVKLANVLATPCQWLLGSKDFKGYTFTSLPSTENTLKIALGIILFVPAAIASLACIHVAIRYDDPFRKRFSNFSESVAYDQLRLLALSKNANFVIDKAFDPYHEQVNFVQATLSSYQSLTWIEKVKSYCWIQSLPEHVRDLLNTRSKSNQQALEWYKWAFDWAKCENGGVADLSTLYQCMPKDLFIEYFEKQFSEHFTDRNNSLKFKVYYQNPDLNKQSTWLDKMLTVCEQDKTKYEFIKEKLQREIKNPDIFKILENVEENIAKKSIVSNYLSELYLQNDKTIINNILDSKLGKNFVKVIPLNYEIIKDLISHLSVEQVKFVLDYSPRYLPDNLDIPYIPFDCILDLILDKKYFNFKISDIEEPILIGDWVHFFNNPVLQQRHMDRIPELLTAFKNYSSEIYIPKITSLLLKIENPIIFSKVFRELNKPDYDAIIIYIDNNIKDLDNEIKDLDNEIKKLEKNIQDLDSENKALKFLKMKLKIKRIVKENWNSLRKKMANPILDITSLATLSIKKMCEKKDLKDKDLKECPTDAKKMLEIIYKPLLLTMKTINIPNN